MATIVDSYSESNHDSGYGYPCGQSFTGNGSILDSAKVFTSREGSPSGNCYIKIYAHSGTFGTSSVPTGSALATSDVRDASTLTSYGLSTFTFSGAERIRLINNTHYVMVFDYSGTDLSIGGDMTSPTHDGNYCGYYNGSWTAYSGYDLCFYIYGEEPSPIIGEKYPLPPFRRSV